MSSIVQQVADYFSPGEDHFWKWSEDGEVVEWFSGDTICYRKDLIDVLFELRNIGLPPIDVVLLIIAGCKDNSQIDNLSAFYQEAAQSIVKKLKIIHELPGSLRNGIARAHLIKEIFKNSNQLLPSNESAFIVREFAYAGKRSIFLTKAPKSKSRSLNFLDGTFAEILNLENLHNLESLLRTGLEQIPEPILLPIPEPSPSQDDLLTQLSQDHQTAGLARLTKRLIAALNIPPHTQGASDQPLGGVSDISNRGDFDRLLLSELANDDDTLSARLVNNEALYLRRETPPDPQVQERVILVDTSLRLWGMPRVFAVSAALGCALNNHQKAGISAFALGKELIGPNALATKEEIIHFLEQQSPILHSGEALRAFFRQKPRSAQRAVFFITSEEVMADKNFSLIFAEQQQQLDYLLVLSRAGTLSFYKLVNGQRSLMSTSVFDLEELLFDRKKSAMLGALVGALKSNAQVQKTINIQGTFLPSFPGRLNRHEVAHHGSLVIAVLPSRRVWLWHNADKGAIEIVDKIEEGRYEFYFENDEIKCIIVQTKEHTFFAYLFNRNTLSMVVDLSQKTIKQVHQWNILPLREIVGTVFNCGFLDGNLILGIQAPGERSYVGYNFTTHFLDLQTNKVTPLAERNYISRPQYLQSLALVKKIINNGYSVLRNIKEIGFTPDGFIQLGKHRIILQNDKLWLIQASSAGLSMQRHQSETWLDHQFYTRTFEWPNGCKITLDSRGFLSFSHIRSYNDFYLVPIIGQELAVFSLRDHYAGNLYFYTTTNPHSIVSPTHFYKRFILEFINAIVKP